MSDQVLNACRLAVYLSPGSESQSRNQTPECFRQEPPFFYPDVGSVPVEGAIMYAFEACTDNQGVNPGGVSTPLQGQENAGSPA